MIHTTIKRHSNASPPLTTLHEPKYVLRTYIPATPAYPNVSMSDSWLFAAARPESNVRSLCELIFFNYLHKSVRRRQSICSCGKHQVFTRHVPQAPLILYRTVQLRLRVLNCSWTPNRITVWPHLDKVQPQVDYSAASRPDTVCQSVVWHDAFG